MPLSTFLNGGTISQLRGLMWLSLSDIGNVGTVTITDDGGGGGTAVWSYGSDLPCRVDPLTGNETIAAGRISDRSTHLITTPPGTMIATESRFAIDNRGTFEVTAVRSRTAGPAQFFEAVEVS